MLMMKEGALVFEQLCLVGRYLETMTRVFHYENKLGIECDSAAGWSI